MRIVSMEKGDEIKRIISRFSLATAKIQEVLKEQGKPLLLIPPFVIVIRSRLYAQ